MLSGKLTRAWIRASASDATPNSSTRNAPTRLVQRVEIVDEPLPRPLPSGIILPTNDVPILLAAIDSRAKYLLTGDKDHFGKYYGQEVEGVRVLRPAAYLATHKPGL
jgi:hypothetical protein